MSLEQNSPPLWGQFPAQKGEISPPSALALSLNQEDAGAEPWGWEEVRDHITPETVTAISFCNSPSVQWEWQPLHGG